jgi:phage tail sheath protein FI
MELLHPGVYVQEVSSGVHPIEGVSTSNTAALGKAQMGALDAARMVTSFIEYETFFGTFLNDSYLTHAAMAYFNNGGQRLYVVRVAHGAATASISVADRKAAPAKTITFSASSAGLWGNALVVIVANGTIDPANEFKVSVQRNGATAEVFDNLSMDPAALNFVEKIVGAGSNLIQAAADPANNSTTSGTSTSGSGAATSLPSDHRKMFINLDQDGAQSITLADPCTTGAEIATAIQNAVRALTPQQATTAPAAFTGFTATFTAGTCTLTSGSTGKFSAVQVTSDPSSNAAALLKLGGTNGGSETAGAAALRPGVGTYNVGTAVVGGNVMAVTAGSDGTTPQDADYMAAFSLLDPVTDVNIVAVPGIGTKAVVAFGTNYCTQRGDCFFVGDMAVTDDTKEEAQAFVNGLTTKTSYGAVYFPWVSIVDPTGAATAPIAVPPSGFVTGIYARTDNRRGVWKAPAGTEANLGGAVGLTKVLTNAEQDTLNPIGVNCLRFFPASGLVAWGARTLGTQSDAEYRYVPVRRFAVFLEQSIYNGIQWAVFEPNGEDLWSSLRLNVGAFMMNLFRAGAFQGTTPAQAFFVKCDDQTNPQSQIDAGIVTVLVGFAPLKPAEFVVLRISQKTADAVA